MITLVACCDGGGEQNGGGEELVDRGQPVCITPLLTAGLPRSSLTINASFF